MAAVNIARVSLPHTMVGYNLTDSVGFTVLTTGSGNGVTFDYLTDSIVVLKNTTGGAAVYTVKVRITTPFTSYAVAVTHPTISVAAGKTVILRLDEPPFKDADGKVTVECDVAGSILVLAP